MSDEQIAIKIARGGICMIDDIETHQFDIIFSRVDCPSMVDFLRMIDIWLPMVQEGKWTITNGAVTLGQILIKNGNHQVQVLTAQNLWQCDLTRKVNCTYNQLRE